MSIYYISYNFEDSNCIDNSMNKLDCQQTNAPEIIANSVKGNSAIYFNGISGTYL